MTFPSSEMKQELIHETTFICYANMTAKSAAYNNIEARVYNTLCDGIILQKRCEGIILQKRFVKKSN
jgi:hypothetical protein